MKCPKCGIELPLKEGWDSMVYHCVPCHIVIDAETGEVCEIKILERLYPVYNPSPGSLGGDEPD